MLLDLILSKNTKSLSQTTSREVVKRSIVKAISWRIIGTLDTICIAFFITGHIRDALSIGLIEWITKMILYFFHERTWNRIKWGKKLLPNERIHK